MKNIYLLPILALFYFTSCEKEPEVIVKNPEAKFVVDTIHTFAPVEVKLNNLSTNFTGTYLWDIQKPPFNIDDTYNTKDVSFEANYTGTYSAKLTAGTSYNSQTFVIKRPKYLFLDKITIKNLGNSYSELYFKLIQGQGFVNQATIYTSTKLFNVTPLSITIGNNDWILPPEYGRLEVIDQISSTDLYYYLEFYDANDVKVASTNFYIADYDNNYKFENGDINLKTSITCSGCDQIEVDVNSAFSQY